MLGDLLEQKDLRAGHGRLLRPEAKSPSESFTPENYKIATESNHENDEAKLFGYGWTAAESPALRF
jgi:hypothetical protein